MSTKDLIVMKIRSMEAELKFLEWVWTELTQEQRDFFINNFVGEVPSKYTK